MIGMMDQEIAEHAVLWEPEFFALSEEYLYAVNDYTCSKQASRLTMASI